MRWNDHMADGCSQSGIFTNYYHPLVHHDVLTSTDTKIVLVMMWSWLSHNVTFMLHQVNICHLTPSCLAKSQVPGHQRSPMSIQCHNTNHNSDRVLTKYIHTTFPGVSVSCAVVLSEISHAVATNVVVVWCVYNGVYAVYNVYMDLVLGAASSSPCPVQWITRGHPDTRPWQGLSHHLTLRLWGPDNIFSQLSYRQPGVIKHSECYGVLKMMKLLYCKGIMKPISSSKQWHGTIADIFTMAS